MKRFYPSRSTVLLRMSIMMLFMIIILIIPLNSAFADANGRIDRAGAPPRNLDCTDCHTTGAAVPTVNLNGPVSVAAGSSNTYSFNITGGGAATVAGLNVAASGGTLATVSAGTQLKAPRTGSVQITHTAPTAYTSGGVTYDFTWTAPATSGTYTLYAAGLSGDGDNSDKGDGTATTTLMIDVTGGSGAPGGGGGAAPTSPLTAVISGPQNSAAGVVTGFNGSASTAGVAPISSFAWDFGDGTAAAGPNVSHIFTAGSFSISLTVTDNSGATATASKSITVAVAGTNVVPTADPGGPYEGTIGTPLDFDGSLSTDPDGSIVNYSWDFGGGAIQTGVTTSFTFDAAGTYLITLTVTDNVDAMASATVEAIITDPATASPSPSPNPPGESISAAEQLYVDNCEECHGPGGVGIAGDGPPIIDVSADDIQTAIDTVADMSALIGVLSEDEIDEIASFLKSPEIESDSVIINSLGGSGANSSVSSGTGIDSSNTLGEGGGNASTSSGTGIDSSNRISSSRQQNKKDKAISQNGSLDWLMLMALSLCVFGFRSLSVKV